MGRRGMSGGQEYRLRLSQEQLVSLIRLLELLAASKHRNHKDAGAILGRLEVAFERGPGVTDLYEIYLRKREASYLERLNDTYIQDKEFKELMLDEEYFNPTEWMHLKSFDPSIQAVKLIGK